MSGSNSQQNGFIVDMSKWNLNDPLQSVDPEIYGLIKDEKDRQRKGLEMIASENFTYTAILDCLGSCLHNKYVFEIQNMRFVKMFSFCFKNTLLLIH